MLLQALEELAKFHQLPWAMVKLFKLPQAELKLGLDSIIKCELAMKQRLVAMLAQVL